MILLKETCIVLFSVDTKEHLKFSIECTPCRLYNVLEANGNHVANHAIRTTSYK